MAAISRDDDLTPRCTNDGDKQHDDAARAEKGQTRETESQLPRQAPSTECMMQSRQKGVGIKREVRLGGYDESEYLEVGYARNNSMLWQAEAGLAGLEYARDVEV